MSRILLYAVLGCAGLLACHNGQAQLLQVIASGGGTQAIGSYTVDFTIGEAVVATIGTDPTCTEGFNQPAIVSHGPDSNLINAKWYIKVYPNPVHDQLSIHAYMDLPGTLDFRLVDIMGRVILNRPMTFQQGYNNGLLDMGNLGRGIYLLYISDAIHGGHQTVKLLKE